MRTLGLLVLAALLPRPAATGRRVAPVAPSCRSELATLERDVEGDEDRCVATASPGCPATARLAVDAEGQSDRCLPEGPAAPSAQAGARPKCPPGLGLEERPERDRCVGVDKPRCPSGLTPRARKGEDMCRN